MYFRLVPTSMTLNDIERRNSPYFGYYAIRGHSRSSKSVPIERPYATSISPNSIALQAYYITVVEARPILSAEYHLPLLTKTDPPYSVVSLR